MKKGFTLVELIMVVAIIAIVSMLAVSKIGNLRDASARKVSVANQQAIGRAVEVWLNAHGQGRINRLDSLLTYEQAKGASSGSGFDYGRTNETNRTSSWLYRGWASIVEAERMQNEGLTPELCAVLVPYGLNAHEAASFTRHLGLNFVMHHLATPGSVHEGEKTMNGTILRDPASLCASPERAAAYAHSVTNAGGEGCYLAAITPVTEAGRRIYRDCGQDLMDTEVNAVYDEAAAEREVQATGGVLFAFGLGENASLIGAAQGGLEAVPQADFPPARHYRNYILLFRLRKNAAGTEIPEFAGVLDPCGQTIRQARLSAK